jgi:Amt family ammonium transporter
MLVDAILNKPSAVGAAIGLVVGLVVVTPAAGFVTVGSAIIMCGIAGVLCNLITRWMKEKLHLDDALDVFACHGVGGMLGAIGTGLLATKGVNAAVAVDGLLIGGEMATFKANMVGVIAVGLFAPIVTFILIKIVNVITPIRVNEADEVAGLDTSVHGETSRHHDRKGYK